MGVQLLAPAPHVDIDSPGPDESPHVPQLSDEAPPVAEDVRCHEQLPPRHPWDPVSR